MTIKENLINPSSTSSLKEFNFLIEKLHQEYDSSLNKNKFIVGGAIEHFLSCLFRSFNLKCTHFGAKSVGFDLIIKDQPFFQLNLVQHYLVLLLLAIKEEKI